jgi:predicted  nucleic acid-binding Zn-ribbon protein
MRFFSIKILILCILLPPLLYLLTVFVLEAQLQERYARGIEEVCAGDPRPLLDGSVRLRDAVRANVEAYLRSSAMTRYGVSIRVQVSTRGGTVLYPAPFEDATDVHTLANPMRVAQDNFTLLSEGLAVQVEARLEHNRLLSNGILGVYVLAALLVLVWHYRTADRHTRRLETERRQEIERLSRLEAENTARLSGLQQEREGLLAEFDALKSVMQDERTHAERNEDDLIGEIEALEKKLADNLGLQTIQQKEIQTLKETLSGYEKEQRREDKTRLKSEEAIRKRFATLYKNLTVKDRAVEGLAELNEELRLKAEEVIHQLNANPDLVPIKRKVFGKKNRETVLEVVFAYKGRLYFRKGQDRRVEVLAVGTKNTQERELEFLANL